MDKRDSRESRAKEENPDPPTGTSRASQDIQVMTVFLVCEDYRDRLEPRV